MKRAISAAAALVLVLAASGLEAADTSNPILSWSSFLGASGDDYATDVTVDASGNVYIVGWAGATWGSPVRAYTANTDAFVAKLSPGGTPLWHTFLGGQFFDLGSAIALDGDGNIFVSGNSAASWGAPVRAYTGATDQFLAKLDASGNLLWHAYLGGLGHEFNHGLVLDPAGNVYVFGASPKTWGSPVNPLNLEGFRDWTIAKVNGSGVLQWNTFHGGTADDIAWSAALDASGGLYVVGECQTGWGSPLNAFSGGPEATIVKLDAATGALQWNSFFGQAGQDYAYSIACDGDDRVAISGMSSAGWGSPVEPFHGGPGDGLVLELRPDGSYIRHTFLGGLGLEKAMSVAIGSDGCVLIGGESTYFWGSPDRPFGGGDWDGFVARLGESGGLQALTFVGGSGTDHLNHLALDGNRNFLVVGSSSAAWGSPVTAFSGSDDGLVYKSTFLPEALARHAVGDFDGDGADEAAVDFGGLGVWMYDGGSWTQLSGENVESLAALDADGDGDDEIAADYGGGGLNLWNGGSLTLLSERDVEALATGDIDGDGTGEIVADFGPTGLWRWSLGSWTQLSGLDVNQAALANLDGLSGQEIIGDFGAAGLWKRQSGSWTQFSGVNADFLACGDTDANGVAEIVGDFGTTGLWLWNAGSWTQLSGVDVNYLIMADTDADAKADIIGDFGPAGLWLWSDGSWTMLSGVREDWMIAANVDASPAREVFVDFATFGLWAYAAGGWNQLSGVNPDYVMSGDFDGDAQAELLADFGTLGLWVCDNGAWTQVSAVNPD